MKRKFIGALSLCLALCLCGCQKTPAVLSDDTDSDSFVEVIREVVDEDEYQENAISSDEEKKNDKDIKNGDQSIENTGKTGETSSKIGQQDSLKTTEPQYSTQTSEFIGRFATTKNGKIFDWSGSTVTAGFEGTGISVTLAATYENAEQKDYFNVYVDDAQPTVLTVTPGVHEYTLAQGLPSGHHTVRLEKRTEAQFGMVIEYCGFSYPSGTKAAPAPARKGKTIWFLGDSITCGYGNEGSGSGFVLEQENAALTYGMLAANALNAEAVLVSRSGIGLKIGLGGANDKTLPYYLTRNLLHSVEATDLKTTAVPDAIVVNIGTNDYAMGVADGDFYTACKQFVSNLYASFPKAQIILMTGGGQDKQLWIFEKVAQEITRKYAAAKISVFEASLKVYLCQPEDLGRDNHPSVIGHRKMADELIAFFRKLGW